MLSKWVVVKFVDSSLFAITLDIFWTTDKYNDIDEIFMELNDSYSMWNDSSFWSLLKVNTGHIDVGLFNDFMTDFFF